MIAKKQLTTLFILAALVIAGVAAVKLPKQPHKNLKILPQDISDQKLDSIMGSYNKALGVKCSFCHARNDSFPDSLDYASDINHFKDDAREMMRMTIYLNQTYFYFDKNERPEYLKVIQCMTCHRGDAYPTDPEIMPAK